MRSNEQQARPPLDPSRVREAMEMYVEDLSRGKYLVQEAGGEEEYVSTRPYLECHCHEAIFRETICVHMIAALIADSDSEATTIARELGWQERKDKSA